MLKKNDIFKLVGCIGVAELAGVIGSVFTASSTRMWYPTLLKPVLNPPSWVFGPVWTVLYALMGVAVFLIWQQGYHRREVRVALGIFVAQLVLNTLWSLIFFGLRSPGAAFVEIVLLWLAILATMVAFARIRTSAALLLAPYLAWVSFAAYLNFMIWKLNF